MQTIGTNREPGLDFLRALAITMVVVFHTVQMAPMEMGAILQLASVGKYGVDLFFVLSGYLIGGLYWRERSMNGSVDLARFWARRWIRTIPPYLIALFFSWVAVAKFRGEQFDWGYLFFVQNYYPEIPFFLVSWSLCIEEHFYLFLPLFLGWKFIATVNFSRLFFGLISFSLASRLLMPEGALDGKFGYPVTATHLRMEGLIIGFWLAYIKNCDAPAWAKLGSSFGKPLILLCICWIIVFYGGDSWMYRLGLTVLACTFALALVKIVSGNNHAFFGSYIVRLISSSAYSIYLTHALMIHLSVFIYKTVAWLPVGFYFAICASLITLAGAVFYSLVEKTSIKIREKLVPAKPFT